MDNNNLNNHICNNNHKRMERNYGGRIEMENTPRREENLNCEGNNVHHHRVEHNNNSYCEKCDHKCKNEHGGDVYTLNVEKSAKRSFLYNKKRVTLHYDFTASTYRPFGQAAVSRVTAADVGGERAQIKCHYTSV